MSMVKKAMATYTNTYMSDGERVRLLIWMDPEPSDEDDVWLIRVTEDEEEWWLEEYDDGIH